jgi:hypothetical protein
LRVDGRSVDVHYRDLESIDHEMEEAMAGRFRKYSEEICLTPPTRLACGRGRRKSGGTAPTNCFITRRVVTRLSPDSLSVSAWSFRRPPVPLTRCSPLEANG